MILTEGQRQQPRRGFSRIMEIVLHHCQWLTINRSSRNEIRRLTSTYSQWQSSYKTRKQRRLETIWTASPRMSLTRTSSKSPMFHSPMSGRKLRMQMLLHQRWTWNSLLVRMQHHILPLSKSNMEVKIQSCHSPRQEEAKLMMHVMPSTDYRKHNSCGKRQQWCKTFEVEILL